MRNPRIRTAARTAALALGLGLTSVAFGGCLGVDGVTSGTVDIYDENFEPIGSFELGETQVDCGTPVTSADATPTSATDGTISVTATSSQVSVVVGTPHLVELTATFTGTYSDDGTVVVLAGDATVTLSRVTDAESCEPIAGPCPITVANLTLSGDTSPATLPTFAGTITTLSGSNATGDVTVNGTANACGLLVALNGGSIAITDLVFDA